MELLGNLAGRAAHRGEESDDNNIGVSLPPGLGGEGGLRSSVLRCRCFSNQNVGVQHKADPRCLLDILGHIKDTSTCPAPLGFLLFVPLLDPSMPWLMERRRRKGWRRWNPYVQSMRRMAFLGGSQAPWSGAEADTQ